MASYDLKAILGEKLRRLTDKTLKALVDCMCTVGASLCSLDKRVSALESVELPEGGYKPMQEPVASPSASGTAIQFIDSISQDATGRVTATKKTVRTGSGSQTGVLKLSDSTSSASGVNGGIAATPAAVKAAYDFASGKASLSDNPSRVVVYGETSKDDVDALVTDGYQPICLYNGNLGGSAWYTYGGKKNDIYYFYAPMYWSGNQSAKEGPKIQWVACSNNGWGYGLSNLQYQFESLILIDIGDMDLYLADTTNYDTTTFNRVQELLGMGQIPVLAINSPGNGIVALHPLVHIDGNCNIQFMNPRDKIVYTLVNSNGNRYWSMFREDGLVYYNVTSRDAVVALVNAGISPVLEYEFTDYNDNVMALRMHDVSFQRSVNGNTVTIGVIRWNAVHYFNSPSPTTKHIQVTLTVNGTWAVREA